jgi:hypothetical protein
MQPSAVVHSIDVVLDRTDQTILSESLNGTFHLPLFLSNLSSPTQYLLPSHFRKCSTPNKGHTGCHICTCPPFSAEFSLIQMTPIS